MSEILSKNSTRNKKYTSFIKIHLTAGITIGDMIRLGISLMRKEKLDFHGFGDREFLSTSQYLVFFSLNLPYDFKNFLYLTTKLSEEEIRDIIILFEKRIEEKKPVFYITNEGWYGATDPKSFFYINEDVFIPRSPLQYHLKSFSEKTDWSNYRVLDLGTGCGCIGIILALTNPKLKVDLSDISQKALKVAQKNVDTYKLNHRIKCIHSDLFENIEDKYDLIITVPPQISKEEYSNNANEPKIALQSGEDGTEHITKILNQASNYLTTHGSLAADIGPRLPLIIKQKYKDIKFKWLDFNKQDWMFNIGKTELEKILI